MKVIVRTTPRTIPQPFLNKHFTPPSSLATLDGILANMPRVSTHSRVLLPLSIAAFTTLGVAQSGRTVTVATDERPACLDAALEAVRTHAPRGVPLIDNPDPSVLRTFTRTLSFDCDRMWLTLSSALHEAVHAATQQARSHYGFWIDDAVVDVPRPAMSGVHLVAPIVVAALPGDAGIVARVYVTDTTSGYDIIGILDELNAYTTGLHVNVDLLAQRPVGYTRSDRDGALSMMLITATYLSATLNPSRVNDSTARTALEADATALQNNPRTVQMIGTLWERAQAALRRSCEIPRERREELGADDATITQRLREETIGICTYAPNLCTAYKQDLANGFGCAHLMPGASRTDPTQIATATVATNTTRTSPASTRRTRVRRRSRTRSR